MSIVQFQKALYKMISDIPSCISVRGGHTDFLDHYDLTRKEERRLVNIAKQPGMNTNCTLFRINRVTPLYTSMPNTCKILQDKLLNVLSEFWEQHPQTTLQYKDEIRLFYHFLKFKIDENEITIKHLDKVLEFEGKVNELRFDDLYSTPQTKGPYRMAKHLRLIKWNCDPKPLLQNIAEDKYHFNYSTNKYYYLLIENLLGQLNLKVIHNTLGQLLENVSQLIDLPNELLKSGLIELNTCTIK